VKRQKRRRGVVARRTRPHNTAVIYKADPSVEYFTPESLRIVSWDVLGGFPELDPCTIARNPMQASRFFTRRDDALARDWGKPKSIFMNPPYGLGLPPWMALLALCVQQGARALALVPARPGARWYARWTQDAQLLCEIHGRVTFELASGKPAPFPARWGAAFLYWGPDRARVARKLASVGVVRLGRRLPAERVKLAPVIDIRQRKLFESEGS
jgi:hypothetical protein